MFIGTASRSEGVKEAKEEVGDAIFICRFGRNMFSQKRAEVESFALLRFGFYFCVFNI